MTINCAERGLLLLRYRDEMRMRSRRSDVDESPDAFDVRKERGGAGGDGGAESAAEARSISHWSPYDRVGVVNAVP